MNISFTPTATAEFAKDFEEWRRQEPDLTLKLKRAGFADGHIVHLETGDIADRILGLCSKKLPEKIRIHLQLLIFNRAKLSVVGDKSLDPELLKLTYEAAIEEVRKNIEHYGTAGKLAVQMGLTRNYSAVINRWLSGQVLIPTVSWEYIFIFLDAKKKGQLPVRAHERELPREKIFAQPINTEQEKIPEKQVVSNRGVVEFCVSHMRDLARLLDAQPPSVEDVRWTDQRALVESVRKLFSRCFVTLELMRQVSLEEEGEPLSFKELTEILGKPTRRKI